MATISGKDNSKIYEIKQFLGINESKDGDTQLKMGEASKMDNWRVTPQYHLHIRPGIRTVHTFEGAVRGMWSGTLGGEDWIVCAAGGGLWAVSLADFQAAAAAYDGSVTPALIGALTDDETSFLGFGERLYILNGHEYLSWDGDTGHMAETVEGYIPLVLTAAVPSGGGTSLEKVNRLTPKRRARFSATGSDTVFVLPDKDLQSVDKVEVGGTEVSNWTGDAANGKVTFTSAPAQGITNVEIWYTVKESLREQVTGMRYFETYNGSTDTRVFLYGDGSNKTIYSGVTEQGKPTAEYFPDMGEVAVDSANTPITGMVKQSAYLMVFKPDGAFSVLYNTLDLADRSMTAGFYVSPINREIGNEAPGQVRAVYNYPRTIYAGNAYDWTLASYGRDERRARYISARVTKTLHQADMKRLRAFDNEQEQEYYLFLNDAAGTALVHRYAYDSGGDVWYRYTGLPVSCGVRNGETVVFGMSDGRLCDFAEGHKSDDGAIIPCVWESGNMDFDADFQRKYSSVIWVSVKPDSNARLTVTAHTDRRTDYTEKLVTENLATFSAMDFRHFSFITNRNPQIKRVKLKVKKFAFYKLALHCSEDSATTTVLSVDIRVRYTGYVK